jgi:hypothetical protein
VDNTRDEFIELHNPTTAAVALGGWRLKGGSDFTFASGTVLRPGDYILVVGFDPVGAPATLSAFRTALSVPTTVPIFGPFSPKLSNDEADVEIARPDLGGVFVNVDKVRYADFSPWPTSADGTGPSLQRESRTVIGNDPANWFALTPTPGAKNSNQTAILDNESDGMTNAYEDANGLDKFVNDAALDRDGDGSTNLAESIAGTDPQSPTSCLSAAVTKIAGGFRIQFTAQAGKGYTIQYRDSLTAGTWLRLTDIAAAGSTQVVTFDDLTAVPQRYYRIATPTVP